MNFYEVPGEGYIPTYTRTDFTDALHDAFGFNTDFEIVSTKNMKKIFKDTKIRKKYAKISAHKKPVIPYSQGFTSFFLPQLSKMDIYHPM